MNHETFIGKYLNNNYQNYCKFIETKRKILYSNIIK